jgi:hypothetical protein
VSHVRCLKHGSTTLAGVRDFGSMMEVIHVSAIQKVKQAVRYDNTAEEFGTGLRMIQYHLELSNVTRLA